MGFIFAFLCASFFAISNIVMKKGMRASPRDNGVFMTLCMNVVVLGMALFIYRLTENQAEPITTAGFWFFVLAGFLTSFVGRTMLLGGIREIGPSRAIAIKNTSPIFTVLFAFMILNETIEIWPWFGMGLLFFGLFLQGYPLFHEGKKSANNLGYLFALGAAVGFGVGQGVRKQAIIYFSDPFAGALIGAIVALISSSLLEARKGNFMETVKFNMRTKNLYYMTGGLFTSLAILCFFISIWYIQVAYVGAIVAAEPILTVILSGIFLKEEEKLTPIIMVSALVVLLGAGVIALTS
jgi:drug/metabolite transporter (DMT)-like permease